MATAPIPRVSPAEYNKLEEETRERFEYLNGEVFAMSGGSAGAQSDRGAHDETDSGVGKRERLRDTGLRPAGCSSGDGVGDLPGCFGVPRKGPVGGSESNGYRQPGGAG